MNTKIDLSGFDRRALLVGGTTLFGGYLAASTPARRLSAQEKKEQREKDSEERILVLLELYGGNDGLNTVVPFANDDYYRVRPKIHIKPDNALKLNEKYGLHPKLTKIRRFWDGGHMAIVQGVGYPKPVYSHFKSFEIWHTARPEGRASGDGWIGRVRGTAWKDDPRAELVVHVGTTVPYALYSADQPIVAFAAPQNFVWAGDKLAEQAFEESARIGNDAAGGGMGREAVLSRLQRTLEDAQATSPRVLKATLEYKPKVEYPDGDLGRALRCIAGMIDADLGGRVYSVQHGNFDTHASQLGPQSSLLEELDQGLGAFLDDLKGRKREKNVLVMAYSEFGRRVAANYSGGTDHGAAGISFFFGEPVRGGFYGAQPSLTELDQDENLIFNLDFRSLYSTVLADWMRVDPKLVLPGDYPKVALLQA